MFSRALEILTAPDYPTRMKGSTAHLREDAFPRIPHLRFGMHSGRLGIHPRSTKQILQLNQILRRLVESHNAF